MPTLPRTFSKKEDEGIRHYQNFHLPTSSKDNPVSQNAIWVAKDLENRHEYRKHHRGCQQPGQGHPARQLNEIEFEEPYHINGDETLLIGYEFYGAGNAMGIDQDPARPDAATGPTSDRAGSHFSQR